MAFVLQLPKSVIWCYAYYLPNILNDLVQIPRENNKQKNKQIVIDDPCPEFPMVSYAARLR